MSHSNSDIDLMRMASENYGEFTLKDVEVLRKVRSETLKQAISLLTERGQIQAAGILVEMLAK